MSIKLMTFDDTNRPFRLPFSGWGWFGHLVALAIVGYAVRSWWAALLIGYLLTMEVAFVVREWCWNRYADRCDASFRTIAAATNELGDQLQAIAARHEAAAATAAAEAAKPKPQKVQWTATSRGLN